MKLKTPQKLSWKTFLLPAALMVPLALVGLFEGCKGNRPLMDFWVSRCMAPLEQALGRLWGMLSFSMAEVLTAAALAGSAVWLIRAAVLAVKKRPGLIRRLLALCGAWLWLWAGVCWGWNAAYYAESFTEKSGLPVGPASVEELAAVTALFAQNAAALSGQVPRDGEGHFLFDPERWFGDAPAVYGHIVEEFPSLTLNSGRAKGLVFSRLQSMLGFTGVYFPFTGEANVNVDSPACLIPVTIAHEMSHQRMVASEQEANFVGIAAAVTSGNATFAYSGYLQGLMELCGALYPADPERWYAIAEEYFTPELSRDWQDNNEYWAALESPVEDAAQQTYDSFLKGNDQQLGIRSYGACVDLLVAWTR